MFQEHLVAESNHRQQDAKQNVHALVLTPSISAAAIIVFFVIPLCMIFTPCHIT